MISLIALSFLTSARPMQQLSVDDIYKKVLPCMVSLEVETQGGQRIHGTGVLAIKDGLAVTSWHLVRGATRVTAKLSDGQTCESTGLVDKDDLTDVAIIKLRIADRKIVALSSSTPEAGSKGYVVGSPKDGEFTIIDGSVSNIRVVNGKKLFEFTPTAATGGSGSALLDSTGALLGLVLTETEGAARLSFGTPAVNIKALDVSLATQPWAKTAEGTTTTPATTNTSPTSTIPHLPPLPERKSPRESDLAGMATKVTRWRVEGAKLSAAVYDLNREITTQQLTKLSVPDSVKNAIQDLRDLGNTLELVSSPDELYRKACWQYATELRTIADGLELLVYATVAAKTKGWKGYPVHLFNQGLNKIDLPQIAWKVVENELRVSLPAAEREKYDPDVLALVTSDRRDRLFPVSHQIGVVFDIRALPKCVVGGVLEQSPIAKSGLQIGDEVVQVDGADVKGWSGFEAVVAKSAGKTLNLKVKHRSGVAEAVKLVVPIF